MTGQEWAVVMALAFDQHADNPTVDQVIEIAVTTYPSKYGTEPLRRALALTAPFELQQQSKLVAFTREGALDWGINPDLPISRIRAIFGGQRGRKRFEVPRDARVPITARHRDRLSLFAEAAPIQT